MASACSSTNTYTSSSSDLPADFSPTLISNRSFEDLKLCPKLIGGLLAMGIHFPTKIQEITLSATLAEPKPQNLVAQSQSGTGKTVAFLLAMLARVDTTKSFPQAVCLTLSYQLALQTYEVAKKLTKYMPDVKIRMVVVGEEVRSNTKFTDHILIGTPRPMFQLATENQCFSLSEVQTFVLDEADQLMPTHGIHDLSIFALNLLSPSCQKLLFTTTFPDNFWRYSQTIIPDAVPVKLHLRELVLKNVEQRYLSFKSKEDKCYFISGLFDTLTDRQMLIFCNDPYDAKWLYEKMQCQGYHKVGILTADLPMSKQSQIISRFREGEDRVLIWSRAPDRGLDFPLVILVIHFDLPVRYEDKRERVDFHAYLHRTGRTGRFGTPGYALTMIDGPRSMDLLKQLERRFEHSILELDYKEE